MRGDKEIMEFRKLSYQSDEFNSIVIALKNDILSRNNMPKLIIGTGLSASFGVPGMKELATELKKHFDNCTDTTLKKAWKEKEADIDRLGLEEGLSSLNTSELLLIDEIRKVTAEFILREEWSQLEQIYKKKSGFEKLLIYLQNTASVNHGVVDIMTPNYDRIIETICDKCGISVVTGFSGEIFKRFDPQRLKNTDLYYNLRNAFAIRLFKPHGSINWIMENGEEILINDYKYLCDHKDNIEIIAPGSSKYEMGMLINTFRIMREDFNELISDVKKPYSLFIYGYGFNDFHFNTVLFQNSHKNILILSKEIKADVIKRAISNPMVTIFFQDHMKEYMIYKGEQIEIDCKMWDMDNFAKIFLG